MGSKTTGNLWAIGQLLSSCLLRMPGGGRLLERLVANHMQEIVKVIHNSQTMSFVAANSLCRYRAESFATKEPDTLEWIEEIPQGSILWDVGANIGLYSIYAAEQRKCQVFAFEPSVFNLEILARNIAVNKLQDKVTIVPLALTDKIGPSMFQMSSTHWGGALSTFDKGIDQHGQAMNPVFEYRTVGMSMDDAVLWLGIPNPNFIKIDVDGIEHFILSGGSDVLKCVDSVLIEIDDDFVVQADQTAKYLKCAGLFLYRKRHMIGGQHNQWWIRPPVLT